MHQWQLTSAPPQRTIITKERIGAFLQGFPAVFRSSVSSVPVTYPITLWQDVELPWLPGDQCGKTIIHGQQALQYFRVLPYNEEIIWQIQLASIRETKGSQGPMQLLDCVMDVRNAHEELILQANTTLLLVDQPKPQRQLQSHTNPATPRLARRTLPSALYGLWDKESSLVPGAVLIDACLGTITGDMLVAYAAASGDYNAIHLDAQKAVEFGLPGRVAHGMLVLGMVGNLLQELQTAHMKLRNLECRFRIPIVEGDTVFAKVIVQSVVPSQPADKGTFIDGDVLNEAEAQNNPVIHCLLEVFIVRPEPDSSCFESNAAAPYTRGQSQRILAYSGSAVYVLV
ncbi:MaoC family dehydratase [Paenibacillus woosongensis]|uniref:MaoC family dehydratase n=1 Tax=Paenibacillus woosongensis TaxID=307580 RepID=A0AA95KS63_9BACL|nr:MaoC family dehydratase [Paenibacillus woosongensis]WHX47063.1 MaoC family dehydratase [Paenibacillus woosongensis]